MKGLLDFFGIYVMHKIKVLNEPVQVAEDFQYDAEYLESEFGIYIRYPYKIKLFSKRLKTPFWFNEEFFPTYSI